MGTACSQLAPEHPEVCWYCQVSEAVGQNCQLTAEECHPSLLPCISCFGVPIRLGFDDIFVSCTCHFGPKISEEINVTTHRTPYGQKA